MKLPKELFIRIDNPPNGPVWFLAADTLEKAMDDTDGPEEIGVYRLVETKRLRKVVTPVERTQKRR
jgi:hypothetical protein